MRRLSGLGIEYGYSPIVTGAGQRYWDESMPGGQGIVSRFLLFQGSDTQLSMPGAERHWLETWSEIVEVRNAPGKHSVLVRPDGYVAWRSSASDDGAAARRALESILQRQARPATALPTTLARAKPIDGRAQSSIFY